MYRRKRVIKFMALLMCLILMGNTPFSSIQGYAADITVKSVDIIPKYGILLEAEIIAKYGEAEIVTEATLPDSETAGTDSTQSEIPEETTSELINE